MKYFYLIYIFSVALLSCSEDSSRSEIKPIQNGYALLSPDSVYQTNLLNGDSLWEWKNKKGEIIKAGPHPEYIGIKKDVRNFAPPQIIKTHKPVLISSNHGTIELGKPIDQFAAVTMKMVRQKVAEVRKLQYTEEPVYVTKTWTGTPLLPTMPAPFFIESYSSQNGLTSDYVSTVCSDSSGRLWIGNDNLISFDGNTYREYATINEKFGALKTIEVDNQNHIWLADVAWGNDGIREFDGKVLRSYTELAKNRQITVNAENLFADRKGRMWLRLDSNIYRLKTGSLQKVATSNWFDKSRLVLIDCDTKGALWIVGAKDNNYAKLKNGNLQPYKLPQNPCTSILDSSGNLWIGTINSLYKHQTNDSIIHFDQSCGLLHSTIEELHCDQEDRLWIQYKNGSIQVIQGNKITTMNDSNAGSSGFSYTDMRYKKTRRFHSDEFGQTWRSYDGSGLKKYKSGVIRNFFLDPSNLKLNPIDHSKDSKDRIWVLTNEEIYIHHLNKGTTYKCNLSEHLNVKNISNIICWKNKIWFKYNSFMCSYNGIELNVFGRKQGFERRFTGAHFAVDKKDKLWFGGFSGLGSFDGTYYTHELPDLDYETAELSVTTLGVDPDNNLFVGLNYLGLALYNQKDFNIIKKNMGIFSAPTSYLGLGKGRHIFGTGGDGIFYLDSHKVVNITTNEGLSHNYVTNVGSDNDGNIWILTDQGANRVIRNEFIDYVENKTKLLPILHLKGKDGYYAINSYGQAEIIADGDNLWHNSGKCLAIVNTKKLNEIKYAPNVQITQININEKENLFFSDSTYEGIEFDEIIPFAGVPKKLTVDYDHNHLSFYFSAVDLGYPHKVEYAYRLKELKSKWSMSGGQGTADFRNLPPGKFTLEVKAKSLANIWSTPIEYEFRVLPPWYRTIWAYIFYFLGAILLVWSLTKWQTNRLKRENLKLEQKVTDRTAEVVAEKNRSDALLLNILPEEVAEELKEKGAADAQLFDEVTVIFTDFKGFTKMSEQLSPRKLVEDLHACFSAFDKICEQHGIEKIKTIGDAYMGAGGLPTPNTTHTSDVVKAALEMADLVNKVKKDKIAAELPFFEVRIGVHTGPVVAGIVGVKKFQYDIWGDTVNTASRMESSGEIGKVNISKATYDLLKDNTDFSFESRGKIEAKGKGEIEMYFVSKT